MNTINHLGNLKIHIMKNARWKRLILIWANASYHVSLMVRNYISAQKDWLTRIQDLSPCHPQADILFAIDESGFTDVEDDKSYSLSRTMI